MSKRTGLISIQTDDGLLHVYVPGKHPDLIIDQREATNDQQRFHVGDFISFIDINGSITSPDRINDLFETRIRNNNLQVKIPVAFPPERYNERAEFTAAMLAWSPDFAFVGCFHALPSRPNRNQMYMAWIQRVPQMTQIVADISIAWEIVGDIADECDEQIKQLIKNAPWNKENHKYSLRMAPRFRRHRMPRTSNQRPHPTILKKYIDNYEGLVTSIYESSARVWSLAIPISEVVFMFGAREGMKVGDWVQFNCEPAVRPYLNCYLHGKKFTIIEPILPAKTYNNTVQVCLMANITTDNIKYFPTGEVTVETERLGAVEFRPGEFRRDFCDKRIPLVVYKDVPSERTGAVWRVFAVANKKLSSYNNRMRSVQGKQLCNAPIQDEIKSLYGVITNLENYHRFIWTKEVGEVLWKVQEDTSLDRFHLGVWIMFDAIPLMQNFRSCAYTVKGEPQIIPPLFETRIVKKHCQIKTKVECDRSAHSDVQTAYSEELGRIFIPDDIPKFGPNTPFGHRDEFLGSFIVWVKRKYGGHYQWEMVEIVERCAENVRHSNSCIDFSNTMEDSASEGDTYNAQVRTRSYGSTESRLQQLDLHDSWPETTSKEVENDVYLDFFHNNALDDRGTKILKPEEEFDPLKEPAFGGTHPHVTKNDDLSRRNWRTTPVKPGNGSRQEMEPLVGLTGSSSTHFSGNSQPWNYGTPNTVQDNKSSGDEQEETESRAVEYWVRAWQIKAVRRQIALTDEILYANVMQLMTDLGARIDGDSLEEARMPLSFDSRW